MKKINKHDAANSNSLLIPNYSYPLNCELTPHYVSTRAGWYNGLFPTSELSSPLSVGDHKTVGGYWRTVRAFPLSASLRNKPVVVELSRQDSFSQNQKYHVTMSKRRGQSDMWLLTSDWCRTMSKQPATDFAKRSGVEQLVSFSEINSRPPRPPRPKSELLEGMQLPFTRHITLHPPVDHEDDTEEPPPSSSGSNRTSMSGTRTTSGKFQACTRSSTLKSGTEKDIPQTLPRSEFNYDSDSESHPYDAESQGVRRFFRFHLLKDSRGSNHR